MWLCCRETSLGHRRCTLVPFVSVESELECEAWSAKSDSCGVHGMRRSVRLTCACISL